MMWRKRERILRNNGIIKIVLGLIALVGIFSLVRSVSGMAQIRLVYANKTAIAQEIVSSRLQKKAIQEERITEWIVASIEEEVSQENDGEEDELQEISEGVEESIDIASIIDFESLWEINEHVYAWITVPGTDIDYPILQHPTDNSKYLNYNIDGSRGYPGCIYTENMNAKDFKDPNTVIYGHNMKNGTMFAGLHKFRDRSFFEENKEVIIYLPDQVLVYEIFAAYLYDDRHLMYSFDFFNQDIFDAYIESIFNIKDKNANIDSEVSVTSQDQIITLATCVSGQSNKRLLVQAKRQD